MLLISTPDNVITINPDEVNIVLALVIFLYFFSVTHLPEINIKFKLSVMKLYNFTYCIRCYYMLSHITTSYLRFQRNSSYLRILDLRIDFIISTHTLPKKSWMFKQKIKHICSRISTQKNVLECITLIYLM